jgi:arsenate reductase
VAHWGIPDPAAVEGADDEKREAFARAYRLLMARISAFMALDLDRMDAGSIKRRLDDIGAMEGATDMARAAEAD